MAGFVSDAPITGPKEDYLGVKDLAKNLAENLVNSQGPVVIGIFGGWGEGKTSLMCLIKHYVSQKGVPTVWFEAWRYHREEDPVLPLMDEILRKCAEAEGVEENFKSKIQNFLGKFNVLRAIKSVQIAGFIHLDFQALFKGEGAPVENLLPSSYFHEGVGLLWKITEQKPVVVFIDDLDRCTGEAAMKLLEALKTVLGIRGLKFVLGLDWERTIRIINSHLFRNSGEDGGLYLEKIIQVHIHLPRIKRDKMVKFIEEQMLRGLEGDAQEKRAASKIVAWLSRDNPRAAKRIVNAFLAVKPRLRGSGLSMALFLTGLILLENEEVKSLLRALKDAESDEEWEKFSGDLFNKLQGEFGEAPDEARKLLEDRAGSKNALNRILEIGEVLEKKEESRCSELNRRLREAVESKEFERIRRILWKMNREGCGAKLQGADLQGADLWGADLEGADLRGVNLGEADLQGADLQGADLQGADLRGADLRGVNLREANLLGAENLQHARGLESVISWVDARLCRSQVEAIRKRYPEVARRIEQEAKIEENC